MKELKEYIDEQYIKKILESFDNPDLTECQLIDECPNNGYNLYLTPHGNKRMHRSKDNFESVTNDYSISDICTITKKAYELIINKYENVNNNLTIGNAKTCVWVKTKKQFKDGKKLNLMYYIKDKKYNSETDSIIYSICVHNGLLSNDIKLLNDKHRYTMEIQLNENNCVQICVIEI